MSDDNSNTGGGISGIYQIRNIHTGRLYIGKSKNIHGRWLAHRYALDRGIHVNDDLQGDWEIYGSKAFEFTVLEEVTGHKALCNAEARHIAMVSGPYNNTRPQTSGAPLDDAIVDVPSITPLVFLELMYFKEPSAVTSVIYASYGIVESTIGALLFKATEQHITEYAEADFAIFEDFGYKGLYNGETARDIAARKDLGPGQCILEHMDSEELAANWFRITLVEAKIRRDGVNNKDDANWTHYAVGKRVRRFILEQGGTPPEELPTSELSIQQIERAEQQRLVGRRQPKRFPAARDQ